MPQVNQRYDCVIVGGGASGLAAAVSVKDAAPDTRVLILEAKDRVGKKILETGNGRCNLSNEALSLKAVPMTDSDDRRSPLPAPEDNYNHPEFVKEVLRSHPFDDVVSFFDSLGLIIALEEDGRAFPSTYAAGSVLDVLRFACDDRGIETRCLFDIEAIERNTEEGDAAFIIAGGNERIAARNLIIATGSPDAESVRLLSGLLDRDAFVPIRPALVPLETERETVKSLNGIRVKCRASLYRSGEDKALAVESGELLFRDYGLSGILAMDLSRFVEPDALDDPGLICSIDLFPFLADEEMLGLLDKRKALFENRDALGFLTGLLQTRVAQAVLKAAGIALRTPIRDIDMRKLSHTLKDLRIPVTGLATEKAKPQVVRGGVSVDLIDPGTMEAASIPGLFIVGEALDVDGRCGGFNLHWAWASGMTAGAAVASRL